jgi:hypothetical protein
MNERAKLGPPALAELIGGPLHFAAFLKDFGTHIEEVMEEQRRRCNEAGLEPPSGLWWEELEAAGEQPVSPGKRYELCALIYRFQERETLRGSLPDPAILDDFLAALVLFYRSLGGTPLLNGKRFYRQVPPAQPFEKFARHVWSCSPRDRRPATEGALIERIKVVMHGQVGWDREAGVRCFWEKRAGFIALRVIADVALAGVDPGETIAVPARLNFEKPRRPEPVSEYWRNRLQDGSVRISRSKSGTKSR